ncbi:MAG: hypothetical protein IKK50_03300 [Ruminiclostridium sp.]|nr:hypothetical protein [Ruminiclostridium sp.]
MIPRGKHPDFDPGTRKKVLALVLSMSLSLAVPAGATKYSNYETIDTKDFVAYEGIGTVTLDLGATGTRALVAQMPMNFPNK